MNNEGTTFQLPFRLAYLYRMKAKRLQSAAIPESQLILQKDGSVYHLGVRGEDIADTVLIVGDPERVPIISALFDSIRLRKENREFVIHTGAWQGQAITVLSSGIGVDNIDILINELDAAVNIDPDTRTPRSDLRSLRLIRIGTCGSLREDIPVGSFIASAFAIGFDGVPWHYLGEMDQEEAEMAAAFRSHTQWAEELARPYCARADQDLLEHIGAGMVQGVTLTANGFYGPQNRSLRLPLSDDQRMERVRSFSHAGWKASNFEMECAGIYALSGMLGHRALTCCVVLANRYREEFSSDPESSIKGLINIVLSRL